MELNEFLNRHPVFTLRQIDEVLRQSRQRNTAAVDAALRRLIRQGRIGRIRRGLLYAVPPGESAQDCAVDLILAASLMAGDAVLAYTSALACQIGVERSEMQKVFFFTAQKSRAVNFRGVRFTPCIQPAELRRTGWTDAGVQTIDWKWWQGFKIQVTNLERSLVDILNRLGFLGGWRTVWPMLDRLPELDLDRIVHYLKWLDNPAATARVGWYIDRAANQSYKAINDYAAFENRFRGRPRYLIPGERGGVLVPQWNLIVPRPLVK